ncbi:hypothetical protein [Marinilabilia rubra]|uniref:hypothetical protein n=1 Tax=Marinilabilia rubra TaxID=2162893 RepID=UPI0011B1E25C|nr:hypothetical protein [Marinilabilia rubra]
MKDCPTWRWLFLLAFMMMFAIDADAQISSDEFYARHIQTQNTGMYILGSWAIVNIATGAWGWGSYDGEKKVFPSDESFLEYCESWYRRFCHLQQSSG